MRHRCCFAGKTRFFDVGQFDMLGSKVQAQQMLSCQKGTAEDSSGGRRMDQRVKKVSMLKFLWTRGCQRCLRFAADASSTEAHKTTPMTNYKDHSLLAFHEDNVWNVK